MLSSKDQANGIIKQAYKKIIAIDKSNKIIVLSVIFAFILVVGLTRLNDNSNNENVVFATTQDNTQTQPNIDAISIQNYSPYNSNRKISPNKD